MEDGEIDSRLRENDKKRGLYYFFNGKDFFARGCFTMIFNFYFLKSRHSYLLFFIHQNILLHQKYPIILRNLDHFLCKTTLAK